MRIRDIHGFSKGRLETARVCSQCGLDVVAGAAPNIYCPKCGHKFIRRPELVNSEAVARLVDDHLEKGGKLA